LRFIRATDWLFLGDWLLFVFQKAACPFFCTGGSTSLEFLGEFEYHHMQEEN